MTIKELRKAKAWSQAHLADASGVSMRTIQRLERTGNCADETLLAIATALDIDVQFLTEGPSHLSPTIFGLPRRIRTRCGKRYHPNRWCAGEFPFSRPAFYLR